MRAYCCLQLAHATARRARRGRCPRRAAVVTPLHCRQSRDCVRGCAHRPRAALLRLLAERAVACAAWEADEVENSFQSESDVASRRVWLSEAVCEPVRHRVCVAGWPLVS